MPSIIAASQASPNAVGGVKVQSPPRSGYSPQVDLTRLSADRWLPGRTIQTNFSGDAAKSATGVASTGVFTTSAAHSYAVGDMVTFVLTTGGSGLTAGLPYFIVSVPSTTTFTVATQPGGTAITFATNLTAGTSQRHADGRNFNWIDAATGATQSNFVYTNSSGRNAIRAADGGTATYASLFTVQNEFRNWEIKLTYRPANDATTSTTDYGPGIYGNWTDPNNNWAATQYHNSANPTMTVGAIKDGTNYGSRIGVALAISPVSTTQDRMFKFRKEGDRVYTKDWATNTVEPDWQLEQRLRPPAGSQSNIGTLDNPEWGACGIRYFFCGAYFLDFTVTELVRQSENLLHNADFSRFDIGVTSDNAFGVSGVASTGVFTTQTAAGTATAHGYSVGNPVAFSGFLGSTNASPVGITPKQIYYVAAVPTSSTFTVATTSGGSAITFNINITNQGAYVIRNPTPSSWSQGNLSSLLSGNSMGLMTTTGPDGSTRQVMQMTCVTPDDPNLVWYQYLYNPLNCCADNTWGSRLQMHPQFVPARRLEFSAWTKGALTAIQSGGGPLGITTDIYMYDINGNLLMDRNTYHPGLNPNTAVDSTDPQSFDGVQIVGSWGWTFLKSIIEISQYPALNYMKFQFLFHETVDTGNVMIADPCLRAIG